MTTPTAEPRWGGRLRPDGEADFAIWAPNQDSMSLRIEDVDHPMERAQDGWWRLRLEAPRPGAHYMFVRSDGMAVPDPASLAQSGDVHSPSVLVDPAAYGWQHDDWQGRPWHETVIYEMHIGTFTAEGTFRAAIAKLDHLVELGVTAIEIMPVAQFSGNRGWGYDGVLLYAPHHAYGSPDDLKALVDAAHGKGLMAFLDVVYNHFGPEGNYIGAYAPEFFHPERHTPWGAAIAYEKPAVRSFMIGNALHWLTEFRFDGLRFDAIDHIRDDESDEELLIEMARQIRQQIPDRPIHLTTEDNRNVTFLHERHEGALIPLYTGEWNDDFHNVAHAIATGETESYYEDFADDRWRKFARALAEGFAFQGEPTSGGEPRGEPSRHLPPTVFVDFLQNHDQVGNRAFGERLIDLADRRCLMALTAILLLSPHIPLLFMGEEWGETRPFAFFTDFHGDLAEAVRQGRRKEFARFAAFTNAARRESIPDPNAESTFEASKIDWSRRNSDDGSEWRAFYRRLLDLRRREIVPRLASAAGGSGTIVQADDGLIAVDWNIDGAVLRLRANLTERQQPNAPAQGRILYAFPDGARDDDALSMSVVLRLDEDRSAE